MEIDSVVFDIYYLLLLLFMNYNTVNLMKPVENLSRPYFFP